MAGLLSRVRARVWTLKTPSHCRAGQQKLNFLSPSRACVRVDTGNYPARPQTGPIGRPQQHRLCHCTSASTSGALEWLAFYSVQKCQHHGQNLAVSLTLPPRQNIRVSLAWLALLQSCCPHPFLTLTDSIPWLALPFSCRTPFIRGKNSPLPPRQPCGNLGVGQSIAQQHQTAKNPAHGLGWWGVVGLWSG